MPSKHAIREIRIVDNDFSAEFAEAGIDRIEIITKPGSEEFKGNLAFGFSDESLNTRNPFAPVRAPYQSRSFNLVVGGPLSKDRATFFLDVGRNREDGNSLVNANVLDSDFNIRPFNTTQLTPLGGLDVSPRFDYQINDSSSLVLRYRYASNYARNRGVGNFSLPSRSYDVSGKRHTLQLTESSVINNKFLNETRFQYVRERRREGDDNTFPTILVQEAFTGGGPDVGLSLDNQDRWELKNFTTWEAGRHFLKVGFDVNSDWVTEASRDNFGGTFIFTGRTAPQLDANDEFVFGPDGQLVFVPISTIESYRRTLYFAHRGLSPLFIRALGGGPAILTLAGGETDSSVRQYEFGSYFQDDWRLRRDFTLSLGLRHEAQTNISSHLDWAPRASFAWSPGKNVSDRKTVIRGGLGIFYDRFSETYSLNANRLNGTNRQEFVVTDPAILDLFPQVPSVEDLVSAIPQTTYRVADGLRTPYTYRSSISIERELPWNFSAAATFSNSRSLHKLRSRNVNAPLPDGGQLPFPTSGPIFQYESSGVVDQQELVLHGSYSPTKDLSFWLSYARVNARSDTDGADNFPSNNYDLSNEYGRSRLDVRNSFYFGGWIQAKWKIGITPLLTYRSGIPFNITSGRDLNRDSLFTERPAFATDLSRPSVVATSFGTFDLNPIPGQRIIPRNFGEGPRFLIANLNLNKPFFINSEPGQSDSTRRKAFFLQNRPYFLMLSVQVQNLFNYTNSGAPIGNLSSSLFGQSLFPAGDWGFGSNQAGNRRISIYLSIGF